jgi:tetratricopeptide (TPR) repeat protein
MELSIRHYRSAVGAAPKFAMGHYDLGIAELAMGHVPRATEEFQRCLELDSCCYAAHYQLAIAFFHAGRLEEALRHFQKCVTLAPDLRMAHYHIGVIYEKLGDFPDCGSCVRT